MAEIIVKMSDDEERLLKDYAKKAGFSVEDFALTAIMEKIKNDEWFWTPEWQERERRADEDIKAGRVSGPFETADEVIAHLHKQAEQREPKAGE